MNTEILIQHDLLRGHQPIYRAGPLVLNLIWAYGSTIYQLDDEAENQELNIYTDFGEARNAFLHERVWRQKNMNKQSPRLMRKSRTRHLG